jgi:hypothetical protein
MKVWWLCSMAIVALIGCGGDTQSGIKTVDVSGTVYLDDQPLEGARINFVSANYAGSGRTDAGGKYRLVSGAEPGENKVYLNKLDNEDPANATDYDMLKAAAEAQGLKEVPGERIPAQYASAEATTLSFTVPPEGSKSADFRLQSKK